MYEKTINLLCAGNKLFVTYQAQGGLTPKTLLRTSLIVLDQVSYRGTNS